MIDQLFRREPQPLPGAEAVTLIEAPDPERESAAVLRRIKALLLQGTPPDQILIALRDWPRYAGPLASLGHEYGLPLALHEGDALNQNPAVVMLLNLLNLPAAQFRRRDLLDVLRSPYFDVPGIGPEQVAQLQAISERFLVTGGAAHWLNAIKRAADPSPSADEDDDSDEALLDRDSQQQLYNALNDFFAAISPPERGTMRDYVRWLGDLIGPDAEPDPEDPAQYSAPYSLNIPAQLAQASTEIADRDRTALAELLRLLRSLLVADSLLTALDANPASDSARFLRELRSAIDQARVNRSPTRTGRVLVTTVTDARGLPHDHVFILGLSEGIFPAPQAEDPLYLDSERQALREAGVLLETQAERAGDEGLFYELIGLAKQTLTLSRPTVMDGAPWIASHLWRAVTAVLSDAEAIIRRSEIRIGAIPVLDEAASMQEFLLSLADGLSQAKPDDAVYPALNWLLRTRGDHWQRIQRARQIELRRMTNAFAHDRFAGRLHDLTLIAYAAEALGPGHLWSASQLNDYGMCGFRFFAKRLLGLETLETPETGLDAARLGTINHAILEATYREVQRRQLDIAPENLDEALAIFEATAGPILEAAPQEQGFAVDGLWEQEIAVLKRHLDALIRLDFSGEGPVTKLIGGARRPLLLEAPFNIDGGIDVSIPIQVEGQEEALRVRGYIDRIDQIGDQALVIDYKTGSTPIKVDDMRAGRNFQMMVYLAAAEQILRAQNGPHQVGGGLFWHLHSQAASGQIRSGRDRPGRGRGGTGAYRALSRCRAARGFQRPSAQAGPGPLRALLRIRRTLPGRQHQPAQTGAGLMNLTQAQHDAVYTHEQNLVVGGRGGIGQDARAGAALSGPAGCARRLAAERAGRHHLHAQSRPGNA